MSCDRKPEDQREHPYNQHDRNERRAGGQQNVGKHDHDSAEARATDKNH